MRPPTGSRALLPEARIAGVGIPTVGTPILPAATIPLPPVVAGQGAATDGLDVGRSAAPVAQAGGDVAAISVGVAVDVAASGVSPPAVPLAPVVSATRSFAGGGVFLRACEAVIVFPGGALLVSGAGGLSPAPPFDGSLGVADGSADSAAGEGVCVAAGVAVGVGVAVGTGVFVGVAVGALVGVAVAVGAGVAVGTIVAVGMIGACTVGVLVGAMVGAGVGGAGVGEEGPDVGMGGTVGGVPVGATVGVAVGGGGEVAVGTAVGMGVGEGMGVGMGVGEGDAAVGFGDDGGAVVGFFVAAGVCVTAGWVAASAGCGLSSA
jgi:hypothetical protein